MLPALPRRQGVSYVHPRRCHGSDPTFAQGIILNYTPEAICQKCIVRTYQVRVAVFGGQRPRHTQKVVGVAAVHHISWATDRAGPSKDVGGLMGTVDVVVVEVAVVHHISWAAVRAGPLKHMGRLMDRAERPI